MFGVKGYDITVNRYDYGANIVWNLKNPDGSEFDLSGLQVEVIIKKEEYHDDASAIYNTVVNGVGSSVIVPLTEQMTGNEVGVYYYALRLIKDGAFVDTILRAKFIISCNTFQEAADGE